MRKGGARAAALLLALALGATGCDLVSSLTPFGIGTRDYSKENNQHNGSWSGQTGNGGVFTFQVSSGLVSNIIFRHNTSDCFSDFKFTALEVKIVDDTFTYENQFETQGAFRIVGRFTSSGSCTGVYSFEARGASACTNMISGSGTFSAIKTQ